MELLFSKQEIESTGFLSEKRQQCLENRYAPQISLSRGIVKSESTTPMPLRQPFGFHRLSRYDATIAVCGASDYANLPRCGVRPFPNRSHR